MVMSMKKNEIGYIILYIIHKVILFFGIIAIALGIFGWTSFGISAIIPGIISLVVSGILWIILGFLGGRID